MGVAPAFPIRQVVGDTEEVVGFFVGLDCNFQTIITDNPTHIFFDQLCLSW